MTPSLTAVRMPIARSAALAVELLGQVLSGVCVDDPAELPSQLIVRGSTAPPRAAEA